MASSGGWKDKVLIIKHEKAVFKGDTENDALAAHSQACECKIDWEHTETIAIEPVWFRRKVREALEIRRLKTGPEESNGLNRDNGDYVTTNTWKTLFDKINSSNKNNSNRVETTTLNIS